MICLIGAPTAAEFESSSRGRRAEGLTTHPPVGILALAAVLEEARIPHRISDLNRLFSDFAQRQPPAPIGEFFAHASRELLNIEADVFGFSTLSSTYPLTIRLAGELKAARPEAVVMFGGPQASAVDVATLEAFPFVDLVVRGEAEEILPLALEAAGHPARLARIPGLTFRRDDRIVRTPDPEHFLDLDRLPLPSYALLPDLDRRTGLSLEAGRGCPFACTFCSTSGFFRRRFRLKSPARILEQMRTLRAAYGIEVFGLIHDSLTADRRKAAALFRALAESGERFCWTCSARPDCLDGELLDLMAQAGCTGIFLGVETGSAKLQRDIDKGLDLEYARAMIREADGRGIKTTVSLITGFPGETREDLRDTTEFLFDSLACPSVESQLHLLAPLAGSLLHQRYRSRLVWDGVLSDMAFQGWQQAPAERELVRAHPEVFPNFFAFPEMHLDRRYLAELRQFLLYGPARFRWLVLALHQHHGGGILGVFDRWRAWRPDDAPHDGQYYAGASFRRDFLDFVETAYLDAADPEMLAVETLLRYERELERAAGGETAGAVSQATGLEAVPRLAPGVSVITLPADFEAVVNCLRQKRSLRDVPRSPVVVADRQKDDAMAEVVRLTPLSAAILELCDGTRTARDISAVLPQLDPGLSRVPPGPACLFVLNELARQGLLL